METWILSLNTWRVIKVSVKFIPFISVINREIAKNVREIFITFILYLYIGLVFRFLFFLTRNLVKVAVPASKSIS